jgi:benzoyl-CoA reductase subunit BamB
VDDAPPEDHWKTRFPELEQQLLDGYYDYKGWNREGIPTRTSLHALGLDYVAEDFLRRRILKPDDEVPEEACAGTTAGSDGHAS